MIWPLAVRALLALAMAACICGGAAAVPVIAIETPNDEFFVMDGPPPPPLIEPPASMVAGLRGMENIAVSAPSNLAPIHIDASDPSAKLLMLLIRLNSKARQAEQDERNDALLKGEPVPQRFGSDGRPWTVRQAPRVHAGETASMLTAPERASWTPASLSPETPRIVSPISSSYLPPLAQTQAAPIPVELMTSQRMQLMPWLLLLVGLVALVSWLGWRNAG